jgi:hypothetical protein
MHYRCVAREKMSNLVKVAFVLGKTLTKFFVRMRNQIPAFTPAIKFLPGALIPDE